MPASPLQTKKRIRLKLNCPELFTQKRLPDHCLVWPTKTSPEPKPTLRQVRDRQFRPYMAPTVIKPLARITVNKQVIYVHRLIHDLTNPDFPPYKSTQICSTTFCVNPKHWTFSPAYAPVFDDPDLEPPVDEPWTLEEAIDLLDRYLIDNPYLPLDPDHDTLIDIPPDLLTQALVASNKEHLRQ